MKRWDLISKNTSIPLEEFLKAIRLILNSTNFSFNHTFYKQIFGTPMGSPLSPILADIIMQDLETVAIERLPFQFPLYYRYVDDIILAAPSSALELTLSLIRYMNDYSLQWKLRGRVGLVSWMSC